MGEIAWAFVSVVGIVAIVVLKLGKLRFGSRGDPALENAVAHLEADLSELRRQLAEMEERVDFTERLLTQARESGALPAPTRSPPGGPA
jgi:hypothetical protein